MVSEENRGTELQGDGIILRLVKRRKLNWMEQTLRANGLPTTVVEGTMEGDKTEGGAT